MNREHSTAYAKIVETEQNKFDVFIGKQGTKGLPTYHVELTDKNAICIDLRSDDATPTSYVPKSMSADGKTKDTKGDVPKIVQSLIDQLLKKGAKSSSASTKTPKVKKETAKKTTKGKKAAKAGAKEPEAVEVAEDVEVMPEFNETIEDGEENVVLVNGAKFSFEEKSTDGMNILTVRRGEQKMMTTYGKDVKTEDKITELAQRILHQWAPEPVSAK